ncbi:MAG: hypothetical protein ACR2G3_12655 [Solirubrobacterales bacterium]
MHVPTLVITPGSRARSYQRASRLVERAASQGFDYWRIGGLFDGELDELALVAADDRWPHAVPASRLPSPLPARLIPVALVTPKGAFLWKPLDEAKAEAWRTRVNRLVDQYRGGHTVVLMDGHC